MSGITAGCGGPAGPVDVYRAYLEALGEGDTHAAFSYLSRSSRERLARGEVAWRQGRTHPLLPTDPPPPPEGRGPPGFVLYEMLVEGEAGVPMLPPEPSALLESIHKDRREAWITVRTPLGPQQAHLVREDGTWRVDLDTGRGR